MLINKQGENKQKYKFLDNQTQPLLDDCSIERKTFEKSKFQNLILREVGIHRKVQFGILNLNVTLALPVYYFDKYFYMDTE